MIIVLSEQRRTDVNGKKYKYFTLFSPERVVQGLRIRSKRCGYIAYAAGYNKTQDPDTMYFLSPGDETEGWIVTKQVEPYLAGGDLITTCTVPVFCSDDDPIEFEIALEKAIAKAGKNLDVGQRLFGEPDRMYNVPVEIPDNCLIVQIIN